ncbi:hypothetical protein RUND412_001106 [Rhizina undulata]
MGNINSHTNSEGNLVEIPDNEPAAMVIGDTIVGTDRAVTPDIINKLAADLNNLKLPGSFSQEEKVSDGDIHVAERSRIFVRRAVIFSFLKRHCLSLNNPKFTYPKDHNGKEERLPKYAETEILAKLVHRSIRDNLPFDDWLRFILHAYRLEAQSIRLKPQGLEICRKHLYKMNALPSDAPKELRLKYYRIKYLYLTHFDWFYGTAENDQFFLQVIDEILRLNNRGNTGVKLSPESERDVVVGMIDWYLEDVAYCCRAGQSERARLKCVPFFVQELFLSALVEIFEERNGEICPGQHLRREEKLIQMIKMAIARSEG